MSADARQDVSTGLSFKTEHDGNTWTFHPEGSPGHSQWKWTDSCGWWHTAPGYASGRQLTTDDMDGMRDVLVNAGVAAKPGYAQWCCEPSDGRNSISGHCANRASWRIGRAFYCAVHKNKHLRKLAK